MPPGTLITLMDYIASGKQGHSGGLIFLNGGDAQIRALEGIIRKGDITVCCQDRKNRGDVNGYFRRFTNGCKP